MLLLSQMKSSKHILFRLLFLTAVLFCLGLEVYNDYYAPICKTELSSELNCEENNVFPSVDAFDDDHINQVHEPFYFVEQRALILNSCNSFLLIDFSLSSWQPPKSA
jgi:hypothetical protein